MEDNDPQRMEDNDPGTHEVSLRDAPAYCLERISRPQHREKEWKLS